MGYNSILQAREPTTQLTQLRFGMRSLCRMDMSLKGCMWVRACVTNPKSDELLWPRLCYKGFAGIAILANPPPDEFIPERVLLPI